MIAYLELYQKLFLLFVIPQYYINKSKIRFFGINLIYNEDYIELLYY